MKKKAKERRYDERKIENEKNGEWVQAAGESRREAKEAKSRSSEQRYEKRSPRIKRKKKRQRARDDMHKREMDKRLLSGL